MLFLALSSPSWVDTAAAAAAGADGTTRDDDVRRMQSAARDKRGRDARTPTNPQAFLTFADRHGRSRIATARIVGEAGSM